MDSLATFYADKRCWVLGGAGFIGRYVAQRLLEMGAEVTIFDDYSRGGQASRKMLKRILEASPRGRAIKYSFAPERAHGNDIVGVKFLPRPAVIFHLAAAMGDIVHNRYNHYQMMVDNLVIHQAVGKMLEEWGPDLPLTLVYSSTACIYGHNVPVPTPEEYGRICDPEPTNHGYGIGKWVGEQLFLCLRQEKLPQLKVRIARFFNAYADQGDYFIDRPHVIPALIRKTVRRELPLPVLGSGNQTRTFVHVQDLTIGLLLLGAAQDTDFYGYPDELDWPIVNLGSAQEHSIREVAETILELEGLPPQIMYLTDEPEGYPRRAAATQRLQYLSQKVLGAPWEPGDPFRETIAGAIQDYRNREQDGTLI